MADSAKIKGKAVKNVMKSKEKKAVILEAIFVGMVLLFIVLSFVTFVADNRRRILDQNTDFIEAATEHTVARVNDLITMSQQNVELLAHLYGSVMTEPVVSPAMLRDMIERSVFDYVEFISSDGMDLTAEGQTADLSDREYFLYGIQGKSGKCVVHNSRITNETLLIFYTPFYYEGRIIGVLSGILRGNTVYDILSSDYFGVQGQCYLLEPDGSVILSAGDDSVPDNYLRLMRENNKFGEEELVKLEQALRSRSSAKFNYQNTDGISSAYITALRDKEWMLVQQFPASVMNTMTEEANFDGVLLVIKLFIAYLVYILFLIVKNGLQKKQLFDEKQEISQIVDVVPKIFSRFALVDFNEDTYEYLEDKKSSAPERGIYSELIEFLEPRYVTEDKNGEKMSTVISPEFVQEHLTEEVPYLQYEYQIDMDGIRWENMSVLCLQWEDGLPSKVLFAIQDVTDLKKREQQIRLALKNASEVAEAASRAKSDFLARMSHDIRTPMNAIMGMTAVAAMHLDDRERLTDCLSKITISSRHLLALINDVLDMSKIESGKIVLSEEPFNMADMVESIMTIVKAQANSKRQQLKVHISGVRHENVIGDTLRLRQIFVNILGNAVKFTPEGGSITFSIQECKSLVHGMACYEFVCEDTGIGMDKEFIKTIFDPFARAQNSVDKNIEGTGLGMSITYNIVRMMEGDIKVESRPGEGSKFTVQIHLKLQDSEAEDVQELKDLKVLVADDNQDSCITTSSILESIGMKAEWVLSGEEAIERTVAAHDAQEDFAAVILDWKMPGKDGVETAREIRMKIGDEVPIIILSAYDWTDVEAQAREAGIQAFIEKPLFRSRLVYALKSVLAQNRQDKKTENIGPAQTGYSGKRVLLVEDNELNREIAEELLSYINISVEQAEDGQMALDMVEKNPPHYYDLIFMDIQMPVMNGYEAARRIRGMGREDTDNIPIIAMTANAFADDIRDAMEAGMNDHVAKPVEVSKLSEMLDKWLPRN